MNIAKLNFFTEYIIEMASIGISKFHYKFTTSNDIRKSLINFLISKTNSQNETTAIFLATRLMLKVTLTVKMG